MYIHAKKCFFSGVGPLELSRAILYDIYLDMDIAMLSTVCIAIIMSTNIKYSRTWVFFCTYARHNIPFINRAPLFYITTLLQAAVYCRVKHSNIVHTFICCCNANYQYKWYCFCKKVEIFKKRERQGRTFISSMYSDIIDIVIKYSLCPKCYSYLYLYINVSNSLLMA